MSVNRFLVQIFPVRLFFWVGPGALSLTLLGFGARSPLAEAQPILPVLPEPRDMPQPHPLPALENPLGISPQSEPNDSNQNQNVPGTWVVEKFEFVGNQAFTQEELERVTAEFVGKPISFAELIEAANRITQLYLDKGYLTSGAYIPIQNIGQNGTFIIQVVEGSLGEPTVRVEAGRLNPNYIRSRIALAASSPLNVEDLQEALQLLQADPLVESVSANLAPSWRPGTNELDVVVRSAAPLQAKITLDNNRAPSVSTFRRGARIEYANLLGVGDRVGLSYTNTDGSDDIEASYALPINARNGTLSFNYSNTSSNIVEPPFDELDIESRSRNYELTLRQPLTRTAKNGVIQELALGVTGSRRESDTKLLGVDFPLSDGANEDGETRLSVLRFFQEFTRSEADRVFSARSQFSLGVGWFDATVNDSAPDSRFFTWRGQLLWLRLLGSERSNPQTSPRLLVRSDIQLAPRSLVPLEQFGLGGGTSVRGYRQDALLTDNGALASVELQLPIYRTSNQQGFLQVIPFVDVGTGWNSDGRDNPDRHFLAGAGLGLRWQQGDRFAVRLDYGIPLVNLDSRELTWQENGLYVSAEFNPF